MRELKSVCVFCGSRTGNREEYLSCAEDVGRRLAESGIRLVYGGGSLGLMGATAHATINAGGKVTGVMPRAMLEREGQANFIDDLRIVESMHERKATMAEVSDGFVALPGGLGTLDELFEILAWAQLGIHAKPVGLLNTNGFYDGLMKFLDHVNSERFLRLDHRTAVVSDSEAAGLLDKLVRG